MQNRGSEWRRWEPHIHAPGTVMNNQFKGPNAWDEYLTTLETATPSIEAIAVTDYYVVDTYLEVLKQRNAGRLSNIKLIFPNVELRLDVAAKSGFVNLHLLVSPDDPNHIEELTRMLSRLQFNVMNDRYDCTKADLIRLGKKANPSIVDDQTALAYGANQFKVNFKQLRDVYAESEWIKKNVLIAVAGGTNDGTSGIRQTADRVVRQEIESFADVIFASTPKQREFWLGDGALSAEEVRKQYRGLKPCLHGSDAHKQDDVAAPSEYRYSWIKGELEFDTLRQACIDPIGRAHIGTEQPTSAHPSQVISHIEITNAAWITTPNIPLNSGLVAIIGARGSGKTALADMIAAGCDSIPKEAWDASESANPSFLVRARPLVGNGKVKVNWASGEPSVRALDGSDVNDYFSYERVRYLSQRFVEELCSANGMTDGLLREIERVIFEAHSNDMREGTVDFVGLLERHASRYRLSRKNEAQAVAQISDQISAELEKKQLVSFYREQVVQKKKLVESRTSDRARLISAGSEQRAARHAELARALDHLHTRLLQLGGRQKTLLEMQDEVRDLRSNKAPEVLRRTQDRHHRSGMTAEQWQAFLLDYKGNVDSDLSRYLREVDSEMTTLKGIAPESGDINTPYFPEDADLRTLTKAMLEAEKTRIEKLISTDLVVQRNYKILSDVIEVETTALHALNEKLLDAEGAKNRASELENLRDETYARAFEALVAEQSVLTELYSPLMTRLAQTTGTLEKLSFSVSRVADVEAWASEAEENLLDLRKSGPFRGKGELLRIANEILKESWENGDPNGVRSAMSEFRKRYRNDLLLHAPVISTDRPAFQAWSKRFAQWLFNTDHISIQYGISYDGVDIRKLSPGTRGIVLLLFYLALDDSDSRPLVIDQPEENLDPKSVFDELVPLFTETKKRRQVIIVTHNANLVINTDADQIIIAESVSHGQKSLPDISYVSGGLENAEVRKAVCSILEGGEDAFRERARRLRVRLER